jgi:hypothetical protein
MFTRLGHVLLIIAMLSATGTHWFVLQSVAWSSMLAAHLRDGSFTDAVQKTFDGRHPCGLCKQIAKGKQEEKNSELRSEWKKVDLVCDRQTMIFCAPHQFRLAPVFESAAPAAAREPPVPPPRGIIA